MSVPESQASKRWDRVYSQNFMTMWYPNEDIIRFSAQLIQKKLTKDKYEVKRKVERVLDLGCGNGRHAIFFARQGLKASGVDISEQAIEWAREWAAGEGLEVDFRVADITNLPYDDGSFDVVVTHGVLDHVAWEISTRAIREVHRVLRPQGLFYCDLRSVEDHEYGVGSPAGRNEFILSEGYEKGLVQHFFAEDEIAALVDGLFRIIYSEIHDLRLGPDFKRKFSRWILATEAL